MQRQSRGVGGIKIRSNYYQRKPHHYNSRFARDERSNHALSSVWDRALSPWARERLEAPLSLRTEPQGARGKSKGNPR